jgi:hypothetical protein
MIDDELRATFEQVGEGDRTVAPLEHILFLDAFPGHLAPRPGKLVAQAREVLFLRQQRLTRLGPYIPSDDPMIRHGAAPL